MLILIKKNVWNIDKLSVEKKTFHLLAWKSINSIENTKRTNNSNKKKKLWHCHFFSLNFASKWFFYDNRFSNSKNYASKPDKIHHWKHSARRRTGKNVALPFVPQITNELETKFHKHNLQIVCTSQNKLSNLI